MLLAFMARTTSSLFVALALAACYFHYFLLADLMIRVVVFRFNRLLNQERRSTARQRLKGAANNFVSCIIGHREDYQTFMDCLASYQNIQGCRYLIVGVDGDQKQDQEMVDVFSKVRTRPCDTELRDELL